MGLTAVPIDARTTGTLRRKVRLLDRVRLVHDVQDRGFLMPAGSQGTVVHVYRGGEGLEVEFISPAHVLLSLDCTQVQPL